MNDNYTPNEQAVLRKYFGLTALPIKRRGSAGSCDDIASRIDMPYIMDTELRNEVACIALGVIQKRLPQSARCRFSLDYERFTVKGVV